jgi:hypothetical protein
MESEGMSENRNLWWGKAFPLVGAQSVSDTPPSAGEFPRNAPRKPETEASCFIIQKTETTCFRNRENVPVCRQFRHAASAAEHSIVLYVERNIPSSDKG